jgi:hypothetical protein
VDRVRSELFCGNFLVIGDAEAGDLDTEAADLIEQAVQVGLVDEVATENSVRAVLVLGHVVEGGSEPDVEASVDDDAIRLW